MQPIPVRWTTPDTVRAQQELEDQIQKRRETWHESRAAQYMYLTFERYCADHPLELGQYQTIHTGKMIALAFQPEAYAVSSSKYGNTEKHVEPRWVALVIRDADSQIVELDPTTLDQVFPAGIVARGRASARHVSHTPARNPDHRQRFNHRDHARRGALVRQA